MQDKSQDFGTSPGRAQRNDWDGGWMTLKRKEFSFGVRSKTQEWQNDPETSLNDQGTIEQLKTIEDWDFLSFWGHLCFLSIDIALDIFG